TVALPFTYIFIPPFARAVYEGEEFGPTYTGMPPMRPEGAAVVVDGTQVEPSTLEVIPRPVIDAPAYERHGPQGPGDSEFMSSEPVPARA
ncbi:MAG: hypothetical protein KY467_10030, partial [Gemmatimonadetes bacterium]|nr:hypothetical protein [Gemmatimonadota bacterium]